MLSGTTLQDFYEVFAEACPSMCLCHGLQQMEKIREF
jgi:hypothetical protein